jgi:uncharacterized protein
MEIDFESLWRFVSAPFSNHVTALHGPEHWRRVEHNGLFLSKQTDAIPDVVRLFALFHDCRRMNDDYDPGHGARGAEYAETLRGNMFELPNEEFDLLRYACAWHTEGVSHENATIATCWDADRLDVGRVGIIPDPKRMCTELGRKVAAAGGVNAFIALPR